MKKIVLLFTLIVSFSNVLKAQTTFVPSDAFESRLQQLGLDSGPLDDLVLTANINTLENFSFSNFIVTDITGLEDFTALKDLSIRDEVTDLTPIEGLTNLESLSISNVLDESLDLSAFTNLNFLSISNSPLSSIDLSSNTNLTELNLEDLTLDSLILGNNPLLDDVFINFVNVPVLDFSNCPALRSLLANVNNDLYLLDVTQNTLLETIEFDENALLTYIDLSANTALTSVRAEDNPLLETIYIKSGNNTNIGQTFRVKDNPMLSCVEVDDVAWSNVFWAFPTNNFPGFSTNCTPTNDDCAQATSITLAQPASGTTISATNSGNNPQCQDSGITILDMWYQFVAPSSGSVTITINAPPLVGKIAIYDNCSSNTPLACTANELQINNLNIGQTYYLQVWLEAGTTRLQNQASGFILNVEEGATLSSQDFQIRDSFSMYPNPASDEFYIQSNTSINEVAILDLTGKVVAQKNGRNSEHLLINTSQLSDGIYMVQVKTGNSILNKKLIIK